jgi:hypothetical protein
MNSRSVKFMAIALGLAAAAIYVGYIVWIGVSF